MKRRQPHAERSPGSGVGLEETSARLTAWVAPTSPAGGTPNMARPSACHARTLTPLTLRTEGGPSRPPLAIPLRRGTLGTSRPRYCGAVVGPEVVASEAHLRPIERRMRRLVAAGVDPAEVAWRFGAAHGVCPRSSSLVRGPIVRRVLRPTRRCSGRWNGGFSPGGRPVRVTPRSGARFGAVRSSSVASRTWRDEAGQSESDDN